MQILFNTFGWGLKVHILSRSVKWCCWSTGHLLSSRTHSSLGPFFCRENGKERSRQVRRVRRGNQRNGKDSKRSWGDSERKTNKQTKNVIIWPSQHLSLLSAPTRVDMKSLYGPTYQPRGFRAWCTVVWELSWSDQLSLATGHRIWDDPQPEPHESVCCLRFLSQHRKNEYQTPVHRRPKAGLILSYNHARDPAKSSPSQHRWIPEHLDGFELILQSL